MQVWCVIPAFNVSRQLPAVIASIRPIINQIVIVNDGSSDLTGVVAESLGVEVIHHTINRGQGAALKTGTEFALDQGADIIVHFDGDGQFRASDLNTILQPLLEGKADIVFGSRFLDRTTALPLIKRLFIMPLARIINRWLFKIRLTDPQSGFRAFAGSVYQQLEWHQDRMAHCSEILIKAHRQPLRLVEVPITVDYHEFGQRFSGGFRIIRDLCLAALNQR